VLRYGYVHRWVTDERHEAFATHPSTSHLSLYYGWKCHCAMFMILIRVSTLIPSKSLVAVAFECHFSRLQNNLGQAAFISFLIMIRVLNCTQAHQAIDKDGLSIAPHPTQSMLKPILVNWIAREKHKRSDLMVGTSCDLSRTVCCNDVKLPLIFIFRIILN
jgi:hypothetical protein